MRIHRWFWLTLITIFLTTVAACLAFTALNKYAPHRHSPRARLVRRLSADKVDMIYMIDRIKLAL